MFSANYGTCTNGTVFGVIKMLIEPIDPSVSYVFIYGFMKVEKEKFIKNEQLKMVDRSIFIRKKNNFLKIFIKENED